MSYDQNNIFAKIIRGEIPCTKVHEDEYTFAFRDIQPQAPVHILVCPKGSYADMDDFTRNASAEEISTLFRVAGELARAEGLPEGGYRLISNCGANGGQEVPHLHLHVLGGRALGPMLSKQD